VEAVFLTGPVAATGARSAELLASLAVQPWAWLFQVGEWARSELGHRPLSGGQAGHRLDTKPGDLGGHNARGGRSGGKSPDQSDPYGRSGLHGRASGA
jgi:hypothetical protein